MLKLKSGYSVVNFKSLELIILWLEDAPVSSSRQTSSSKQASSSGQALSSGSQGDTSSSGAVSHPSPTVQPQTRPYLIQAPTFPPVDLLSDVVGTQVDQSAETITWPNGWESVLPTGMKNGVNVLKAVSLFFPLLGLSKLILIRMRNACDGVVAGGVASNWKKFENFDDLDSEFGLGISKNLTLQMHGWNLKQRAQSTSDFHRLTTVSDFIKDANNPDVVGMILDVPTSRQSLPEPYQSSTSFHIDTLFAPMWALLHHAGTYTNVHQDAGGYSVAGQVLGDRNNPQPKMWAIMTLKNPVAASQMPEKVAKQMASISQYSRIQAELKVGNKLDQKVEAMAEIVAHVCFEISPAPRDERKVTVGALVKILEGDYQEPGVAFRLEPETVQTIEEFAVKYWEAFGAKKKKTMKKG
ncbi:hypothetical protein DFH05DRAFT_1461915 [Lentinula detonsa]|uniref:Clavaminate synthase-like protein n=1 Tax=Lentinula detonsa TaxID=2804962 RepID=A0A9W8TVQ5_9AGAR|nr:hypothetical protein DFH05DRAFT_1461915 [Lentinula detonsa]